MKLGLNIAGFEVGGKIDSSFSSAEGYTNTARLIGEFSVSQVVTPVPAAAWLMVSGLGLLAGMDRQRRRANDRAG